MSDATNMDEVLKCCENELMGFIVEVKQRCLEREITDEKLIRDGIVYFLNNGDQCVVSWKDYF